MEWAELGSWFRKAGWRMWTGLVSVLADLMVCCMVRAELWSGFRESDLGMWTGLLAVLADLMDDCMVLAELGSLILKFGLVV